MRTLIAAIAAGIVLTSLFGVSSPASANPSGEHPVLACIGNGHSCTHDNNCCSGNCVNRTCK
jgi:hypothetical protein